MVHNGHTHTHSNETGNTIPKTSFRVKIWEVKGSLNTPACPVVVKFDVDSGKYKACTNVVNDTREPKWLFTPPSKNNGPSASASISIDGTGEPPLRRDIKFLYHTKAPERLPQKLLVVSLCGRNEKGDTEWGRASVPLDMLARGCERVRLSMINKDKNYATIEFCCIMREIKKVEVSLSDLRVIDYPARHRHEVKMVFFEFGSSQFGDGYKIGTEKSSQGEPIFKQLPLLSHTCSLYEMINGTVNGSQLQVFFSFHRQVSRERTEEIGIGALPIKMILPKKKLGSDQISSKFRVPLADNKGLIKGRVVMRNFPQYSQLVGDDIAYHDGAFTPANVDLRKRQLLPWIELPRQPRAPQHQAPHQQQPQPQQQSKTPPASPPVIGSGQISGPAPNGVYSHANGHYSPTNSSTPDNSSGKLYPVARAYGGAAPAGAYPYIPAREGQQNFAYVPHAMYNGSSGAHSPQNGWSQQPYGGTAQGPTPPQNVGSTAQPTNNGVTTFLPQARLSDESGSAHLSSDGMPSIAGSSYGYPGGQTDLGIGALDLRTDEWVPVRLPNSDRFYFANRRTKESLWLPPRWERREDDLGRQYFVDHNSQTTQFGFPAEQARLYREQAKTTGP